MESIETRRWIVAASLAAIGAIALVDWLVVPNLALGFLYLLPLVAAAGFLSRVQILILAATCATLREILAPFAFSSGISARLLFVFSAFSSTALFVGETMRRRREASASAMALATESRRRVRSESRLRDLVDTTPAAVILTDDHGRIELANQAAAGVLGIEQSAAIGEPIVKYFPALASTFRLERPPAGFRTVMESSGARADGQGFLARVWLSVGSSEHAGMALIVADISDEFREVERSGMESLMASSELILRSFAHEVHNLATAMQATVVALSSRAKLEGTPERQALDALISALRELAKSPSPSRRTRTSTVDLASLLTDLSIVLEPELKEAGIELRLDIQGKPQVAAERHGLMQAFLNMAYNGVTALRGTTNPKMDIQVWEEQSRVAVRFINNGPPPADPSALFQAFRSGSGRSGLGLYVSQSIVKSFGGKIRYEPHPSGCCFVTELLEIECHGHEAA